MAGLEAKLCPSVINQIVFGIEPTMAQLHILVGLIPRGLAPPVCQRHKGGQKRRAHILGQREISRPIAAVAVIIKNPANPPRPFAVRI